MGVDIEGDKEVWIKDEWSREIFIVEKIRVIGVVRACIWDWVWKLVAVDWSK